jgi:hypothetical protein
MATKRHRVGKGRKIRISARVRDGGRWGDCEFSASSLESGIRTAARKLGLKGPILTKQRVGSEQYDVNVYGRSMMVIEKAGV